MMTVSDYLRYLRGRLESMRYEIDIYERIFGLKPNDPDASQQAMQGLQDRFDDIGVLKADNDRLQAEVERLQSRNAWLSGLETLTTTQQEELVEQRTAMQGLAEALRGLIPEGWDDGTMDHMPGIKQAYAALEKAAPFLDAT